MWAKGLVCLHTEEAGQAATVEPLDAGVVANLKVFDQLAPGYYYTGAFVTADKWELCWERLITHHGVEVGMADARVFDVDKNFIRAGLLDSDLLVGYRYNILLESATTWLPLRLFYRT